MNIRYLQKLLSRINEIKIIGKSVVIDGVVSNLAGIVRNDMQLRLLILEYNEKFQLQIEEREINELSDGYHVSETNRILIKGRDKATQPFIHIKSVMIGDKKFEVKGSESHRLSIQDGESVLFLWELLKNGWNPEGIDYQNIDMLFLTSIELSGDFNVIPDFGDNPKIHLAMGRNSASYLVEQPITLTVNGDYSEKIWFENKETGEEHWAQINSVRLMDMWAEMEKIFSDTKLLNQMTDEQITKAKKDFEEKFSKICPKGMCYLIVEYECEEGISLQFYTKNYLESKPVQENGGMGFIVGAERPRGILGMKLKAEIIQEPVTAETVSIDAELFQYYKTNIPEDIILE